VVHTTGSTIDLLRKTSGRFWELFSKLFQISTCRFGWTTIGIAISSISLANTSLQPLNCAYSKYETTASSYACRIANLRSYSERMWNPSGVTCVASFSAATQRLRTFSSCKRVLPNQAPPKHWKEDDTMTHFP